MSTSAFNLVLFFCSPPDLPFPKHWKGQPRRVTGVRHRVFQKIRKECRGSKLHKTIIDEWLAIPSERGWKKNRSARRCHVFICFSYTIRIFHTPRIPYNSYSQEVQTVPPSHGDDGQMKNARLGEGTLGAFFVDQDPFGIFLGYLKYGNMVFHHVPS